MRPALENCAGLVYSDGLTRERGVVALKTPEVDALADAPVPYVAAVGPFDRLSTGVYYCR